MGGCQVYVSQPGVEQSRPKSFCTTCGEAGSFNVMGAVSEVEMKSCMTRTCCRMSPSRTTLLSTVESPRTAAGSLKDLWISQSFSIFRERIALAYQKEPCSCRASARRPKMTPHRRRSKVWMLLGPDPRSSGLQLESLSFSG